MRNLAMTETGERASQTPVSSAMRNYTILGILSWFSSALVAGWWGLFSQSGGPPTAVGWFVLTPMIVFTALFLTSAPFRALTKSIPLPLIVGAHLWRFVGIGFVIAVFLGKLPPEFGIPEGIGDIIAAALALPLARALYRGRPVRRSFIAWNIFGFLDLVSAITMGVLYSQGSFGVLRTGLSTELMTTFPVSLIPTFFVPLFILLHVLALIRRDEVGTPGRVATRSAPSTVA